MQKKHFYKSVSIIPSTHFSFKHTFCADFSSFYILVLWAQTPPGEQLASHSSTCAKLVFSCFSSFQLSRSFQQINGASCMSLSSLAEHNIEWFLNNKIAQHKWFIPFCFIYLLKWQMISIRVDWNLGEKTPGKSKITGEVATSALCPAWVAAS